ncbi:MAG: Lrp/AsnC family transcriptional regulator [Ilumatobacteraceae bacterium]
MDDRRPAIDALDRRLIGRLRSAPHSTISDLARELNCARGTVLTRLRRLEERRVIVGYGPDIDPAAAGLGVLAFTTLAISQGSHVRVVAHLRSIPEILEIHTVTGSGDLLVRIVARSNDHLHVILQRVVSSPDVNRTETQLALSSTTLRTTADLVAANLGADGG